MAHEIVLFIFYAGILIYTIVIHEVMHGVVASMQGDNTAKYAGRLNLNPINHIDLFGSIVTPILLLLASSGTLAFGWAKPVPVNLYNLRNQKWGPVYVALAGPGINLAIAAFAAILAKFVILPLSVKSTILNNFNNWEVVASIISGSGAAIVYEILLMIIFWNVILAVFNLIPIPPADGSRLLYALFPIRNETKMFLEQYGLLIILAVVFLFGGVISFLIGSVLEPLLFITL